MFGMPINHLRSQMRAESIMRELCVLSLITAAFFIAFALYSYCPHDASWFFYSTDTDVMVRNTAGPVGANCAALLIYLYGAAASGIVIWVLFIAYLVGSRARWADEWGRMIACALLMMILSILCARYGIDYAVNQYPGGHIGIAMYTMLRQWFGNYGSMLCIYAGLYATVLVLFRFSCVGFVMAAIDIMRTIGRWLYVYPSMNRMRIGLSTIGGYAIMPFVFVCTLCAQLRTRFSFYGAGALNEDEFASLMETDFSDLLIEKEEKIEGQHAREIQKDFFDAHDVSNQKDMPAQELTGHDSVMERDMVAQEGATCEQGTPTQKNISTQKSVVCDASDQKDMAAQESVAPPYFLPNVKIFFGADYERMRARTRDRNQLDETRKKELEMRALTLQEKLKRFDIEGEVVSIKRGPVVTLFEYKPNIDIKLSKIVALEDDLAMALSAYGIRILAPIPGTHLVGFEVANTNRTDVLWADIVASPQYLAMQYALPLVLGSDTIGNHVVVDLANMPHLLVAGSTGSGKSVALNAMLTSMLCARTPDELALILIDPKRLEFSAYADISHLLFPIVTDTQLVAPILRFVVQQMEMRYERMAVCGVRNSVDYNRLAQRDATYEPMPFIVVVIDELADLMMTVGKEVEDLIARLAQMARAAGIHLLIATQRPSVDVITGLIKVNFPSRISFRVTSRVDSRTILDCMGAEKLLGRGDMLFLDSTRSMLTRVHGAYVSDKEIEQIVSHIRAQRAPKYVDIQQYMQQDKAVVSTGMDAEEQKLYASVLEFLQEVDTVSISLLQRTFKIGYNRSAGIIEMLEVQGFIMPAHGGKPRRVIK